MSEAGAETGTKIGARMVRLPTVFTDAYNTVPVKTDVAQETVQK